MRDPEFIIFTGPMFGSKTTRLLAAVDRYKYQNKDIVAFKPRMDNRYSGVEICTHSGGKISAVGVETGHDILKFIEDLEGDVDVIAIDEAFMIDDCAEAALKLFRSGITVIISSLQLSASGNVFEEIRDMMPWATRIEICPAVCPITGRDAFYTHRKIDSIDEITVGGADISSMQSKDSFNEEVDYMGATLVLSASGGYVSSLKRYFPRILEMMADGLINPKFTKEDFEREINVALEGIKYIEKDVQTIANRVHSKLRFGYNHPFGEFETLESLNNISLKDIQNYYKKFAIPNNAYLTVVGDVQYDEIKSLVESLFGDWKKGKKSSYSLPQANNLDNVEINFVDMSNAVQSEIYVGNLMDISMNNPDYFALKLGNQILGGSSTARLFMNLREDKGFTYGSYSSASTSRYKGSFTASASVRNEVTDSAITEIIKEINLISSEGVTDEELDAAKEKYVGSFIMSTEQPSTIANFATNIAKFNLAENFYEKYLENFQSVTTEDVKRVINKYLLKDNLRVLVVGKGQDILSSLEAMSYNINYYDKEGNATEKPDFSTPSGVTVESVLNNYLNAIGGVDKVAEINAVSMLAEAEVQGMKLQMVNIQAKPNKQVMMMMMMGNTMMKMVFDGEKGSLSQQGMNNPLPDDQVQDMINSTLPFEEIGWLEDENVKFSSVEEEDGKTLHVLQVSDNSFVSYDAETGLKYKQTELAEMPDGSKVPQSTYFEDYRDVNGILFPYVVKIPMGPQSLDMNVINLTLNPEVSDSDFTVEN